MNVVSFELLFCGKKKCEFSPSVFMENDKIKVWNNTSKYTDFLGFY